MVASLTHAVIALRDDPARCAAMGAAARRMFEARFDLPVALSGQHQLLAGVTKGVAS
jgi:glycosyltransferase involved in cell wall biosynthesis